MESRLVKILNDDFEVGELSEENIEEYVQTVNSKKAYIKHIIQPYEAMAVLLGSSPVFEEKGLVVKLNKRTTKQKYSDKQIVNLTETYLDTMGLVNSHGKQAYGIKRFNESIAIDVCFLQDLMDHWSGLVFGYNETTTPKYEGSNIDDIVKLYSPSLLIDAVSYVPDVTENATKLYIAAKEQSDRLTKKVIKPFEKAFKTQAKTSPKKTVFDTKPYGKLAVQVKTVPRHEPDYKIVKEMLVGYLAQHESFDLVDNDTTFLNNAISEPKVYMDMLHIHDYIHVAKTMPVFKQRQEIEVLYNPVDAVVISF